MTAYLAMLAIPFLFALIEQPSKPGAVYMQPMFWLYMSWLVVLIGMRFEVGGDWLNYIYLFDRTRIISLADALTLSEPGYMLANWVAARSNVDIWGVNLICALFFVYGLSKFCRELPRPWLGVLAATPYLILAVAMGYSRQGVAVGLVMASLASLSRGHRRGFFVHLALAALFHKTALIITPLAFISSSRSVLALAAGGAVAGFFAYDRLLAFVGADALSLYVEGQLQSGGALARLLINAFPAAIYLVLRKRIHTSDQMRLVWTLLSIAAIVLVPVYFVLPYSTIIDRLGLYLIPIQLLVYSHLPEIFGRRLLANRLAIFGVGVFATAVMVTWLSIGTYADDWLPYQMYSLGF